MPRICLPNIVAGAKIGQTQLVPDKRICLSHMGVGMIKGDAGIIITYGTAGAITYGAAGKIVY